MSTTSIPPTEATIASAPPSSETTETASAPAIISSRPTTPDAVVVGSGINGLAAAVTLARAGLCVWVFEAEDTFGGSVSSAELTLPGFIHDVCSAVYPMAVASPFFRELELDDFGLQFIQPEAALAHPFDNGGAAVLTGSLEESLDQFGDDAPAIQKLLGPLIKDWEQLSGDILRPLHFPAHPFELAAFGLKAIRSAQSLAYSRFKADKARGVFAGMAAHSILPLDRRGSASVGLIMWTMAHCGGWPIAAGGSQSITNALIAYLKQLGGDAFPARRIASLDELPQARAILLDLSPKQFISIARNRISSSERNSLEKVRYGPGTYKVDWALDAPIPWNAPQCALAGTVHIGGTLEEIAESEKAPWWGTPPPKPFILLSQPSLFDPTRAPQGKHTVWGYCHVPYAGKFDMLERIESQIERFASGFKSHVLARHVSPPAAMEKRNANLSGGDITLGAMTLNQIFFRPTRRMYSTSIPRVYLCSAATPPGPGVHGMCGWAAAHRVLKECFPSTQTSRA
jgi:phytoene dehydrogenase-like protein